MIVDRLENADRYRVLGERFAVAIDWLQNEDLSAMATGRHEIRGEEIYALIHRYQPRRRADAKWEAHRKYFDVQYVVAGREQMGYAPIDTLNESDPYDPNTDAVMLTGPGDFITAPEGTLFILGPDDAHMPAIAPEPEGRSAAEVTKVVVKVAID